MVLFGNWGYNISVCFGVVLRIKYSDSWIVFMIVFGIRSLVVVINIIIIINYISYLRIFSNIMIGFRIYSIVI